MPPRHILSPQSRAALFDPPTEPAAIVRHYTFSPEDLALIRRLRPAANRLGFAVHRDFPAACSAQVKRLPLKCWLS